MDDQTLDQTHRGYDGPSVPARIAVWSLKKRLGGALFLGLLTALAMPPVHVVPVLVPAFVGLVLLLDTAGGWRQGLFLGWVFGFGFFAGGLYWITEAFLVDIERFGWMAPFALVFGAGALAIETAVAAALYVRLRPKGWYRIVLFPALWTLSEVFRGWAFTGFPWNLMGSAWAAWDAPLQIASVIGVFGLSALTVLAAAAPVVLFDPEASSKRRRAVAALSIVIPIALFAHGALRLPTTWTEAGLASLRLVQPNIIQAEKWKRELRAGHVAKQIRMSLGDDGTGSVNPPPDDALVIWAETSVPFGLPLQSDVVAALGQAVPKSGKLIVGAPRPIRQAERPWPVFNSVFVFGSRGTIEQVYDKHHLVPFGEYLPLRRFLQPLGIDKLAQGLGDFSPGPGPRTLELDGYPDVGVLICYEIIFPDAIVSSDKRPEWLLNMTNDAWFGTSAGPYQHYVAARLRAVEQGLPVVRVANGGITAVIDPFGRESGRLDLGRQALLDMALPPPLSPTPFTRFGSLPVVLFSFFILVAGIFRLAKTPESE